MLPKFAICLTLYVYILIGISRAQYHYKGVRNVNQMEPPSLESAAMLVGRNEQQNEQTLVKDAGDEGRPPPQPDSYQQPQSRSFGQPYGQPQPQPQPMSRGFNQPQPQPMPGPAPSQMQFQGQQQYQPPYQPQPRADANMVEEEPSQYQGPPMNEAHAEIMGAEARLNNKCNRPRSRALQVQDAVTPNILMIERKKEESPMKEIQRIHLQHSGPIHEEQELKPNIREKIETYTETYVVTSIASRVVTRKRMFMQKRKVINQKINKPVLIIRRKLIKERQIFERIIPKIVETREIINNPSVKSKILEGPIYEVSPSVVKGPSARAGGGGRRRRRKQFQFENLEGDCPEVEFDPDSGETMDASAVVDGSNVDYKYLG